MTVENERQAQERADPLGQNKGGEATIAILVRSRTHLKEIIRELEFLKISYKAESIYTLADRPAIRDLLSLLRALIFPLDRVAWLSLLRARQNNL